MAKRGHKGRDRLTGKFLGQFREYLTREGLYVRDAGKIFNTSPSDFQDRMKEAYDAGYVVIKGKDASDKASDLKDHWNDHPFDAKVVRVFVAEGCPDSDTFAYYAAEKLALLLGEILAAKDTVTIGIVSGSSTGETIRQFVESRLWDELIGNTEIRAKKINVIALNVTPVDGWELEGNANIAVLRLAMFLRERGCKVMPYGLNAPLVVSAAQRQDADNMNRKVISLADPSRLKLTGQPQLDLVITGVGVPENSVFQEVLEAEGIHAPKTMVGDVAFSPVDAEGGPLDLLRGSRRKTQVCLIYSAIRLGTLKQLVEPHLAKVMLIARNRRCVAGEAANTVVVTKTGAITAAIRGRYVNVLVTDGATADQL